MLTEHRHELILQMLNYKGSVTVKEIKEKLHSSDSTIRRDLNELAAAGKLTKVFGGAMAVDANDQKMLTELSVSQKSNVNTLQKQRIGRYAATLINPEDCVYIDAGTTTEYMLDYIEEKNATYITNGVTHARKLAVAGFKVFLVGGDIKGTTEAVIGSYAIKTIQRFNFNKGFFGANGVNVVNGITTPDESEALVKESAVERCKRKYILVDSSKFDQISAVKFADFDDVKLITDMIPRNYANMSNIIQVE